MSNPQSIKSHLLAACFAALAAFSARAEDLKLPPLRPLLDYPVRDTSICIGGDGLYYMTGTTGHPTWWQTNEGIRVWKSADLKIWEPLGLVWKIEQGTWQKVKHGNDLALWAPEIHYSKGTFWLTHCMNFGGTGLLKSTSGKAEGPYVDVHPEGPLTGEIDASLFVDDDGKVYWVYQNGKIARMKDDMSGLAEKPRLLSPWNATQVGFEGAFITKIRGRYVLICAEFNDRLGTKTYDCMAATAKNIYGPYGPRYLAIPHGGHNMLFKDKQGQWWSTLFGSDPKAPFRERPAIVPLEIDEEGHVRPQTP
jgi:xylan 1,4-beta-xylosidase